MRYAVYFALFLPLVSFLSLILLSHVIGRLWTQRIACTAVFTAFICFVGILVTYTSEGMAPHKIFLFHWIPVQGINADFALRIDPLSLLMALIITGVGFLIHVYSIGYMEYERDFARYFACLNFFVFAMLLLVLASHLLLLFVGWEGVGLASYLLIGFWYQRPTAAQAATKAFVMNRIGDLGLLLGLLLVFHIFGTGDIAEISQRAAQELSNGAPLGLVTMLLFIGAIGKSAQLPLHTWLPDAMEGPTPVSALIHAATMVTAGVYLVVRLHALFILAPETLQIIGTVGGVTSLFAALCAVGQTDLKRVLAYSTISQLGLMFLACGVGAFYAAMFHLTTHAFMKALLFLSAGNVIHMMHGTTLMEKMGGLSRQFGITHWLFLIGVLAMSGVPPLAAFFSKDLILEQEHLAGFETLFYVGLTSSILTAFYLTRAYCLTFTGVGHSTGEHVREAPRVMLTPVAILGLLSIVGGFLGCCDHTSLLESFLAEVGITLIANDVGGGFLLTRETWLSIGGALLGVGSAAALYTSFRERLGLPATALHRAFFIDEIYSAAIVRPLETLAQFIAKTAELRLFQGSIDVMATATQRGAAALQQLQSGQIRSYVAWMVLGMTAILALFLL